jgi:hypothetical protein
VRERRSLGGRRSGTIRNQQIRDRRPRALGTFVHGEIELEKSLEKIGLYHVSIVDRRRIEVDLDCELYTRVPAGEAAFANEDLGVRSRKYF